jgi:hypothetical protein
MSERTLWECFCDEDPNLTYDLRLRVLIDAYTAAICQQVLVLQYLEVKLCHLLLYLFCVGPIERISLWKISLCLNCLCTLLLKIVIFVSK